MIQRLLQSVIGISLVLSFSTELKADPSVSYVYKDSVIAPWQNNSWASVNLNATPAISGSSIAVNMGPWTALYFNHPGFSTKGMDSLVLSINPGVSSDLSILVKTVSNNVLSAGIMLTPTCVGSVLKANTWLVCTIPIASIAPATDAILTGLVFQEATGKTLSVFYVDEIGFTNKVSTVPVLSVSVIPPLKQYVVQMDMFKVDVIGTTDQGVNWSIEEGSAGGSISSNGIYTPSIIPGTYHLVATSKVDPTKTGKSSIIILPGNLTQGTSSSSSSSGAPSTGTVIVAGDVNTQDWTLAKSPYKITGDIVVPLNQKLTIQPGVVVQFQGHYRMTVTGLLDARGTSSLPITFTSMDHNAGWYGVRIWNPVGPAGAMAGSQYVENCIFEYSNKQGNNDAWYNDSRGALFVDSYLGSNLHINNNIFRNNKSIGKGAALMLGSISGNWTLTGNTFLNNHATDEGGAVDLKHSTATTTFSGGSFTGNSSDAGGGGIVIFNDSKVAFTGVNFSNNSPDNWTGVVPTIIGTPPPIVPATTKWVSGYYVGYQNTMYPPASVDFTSITHLMVGAALPNVDGTLDIGFYLGSVNGPLLAKDLTSKAHQSGKKAVMMMGGSGATTGWEGAASDKNRAAFIKNILAAMEQLGFDGVDLDWEPVSTTDKPLFLALAKELRSAAPNTIITIPVTWVGAYAGADAWYSQIASYADHINIMSYQMADAWSGWKSWHSGALSGETVNTPSSVSSSANAFAAVGIPKSKIGIGIGFYGSCWKGVTGPNQDVTGASIVANDNIMTYDNITKNYIGTVQWDSSASMDSVSFPIPHGPQGCTWVSYEDDKSIAVKGKWVKDNGFGGTIIWTINQGYIPATKTNPLLDAVKRSFLQ